MKIAFIGQKGIPAKFGGVERYAEEVASELAQRGHEVFVYARNNYTSKDIREYKGIKLIRLPSIPTKNLDAISHTFLATFHAIFKDYDVIHYHSIGPASLSFFVRIFRPGIIIVSTFQCQDYYHQKWGFLARTYLRLGEYVTCKVPDKTIVVSTSLEKYVRKKYASGKIVRIPNGARVKFHEESDEIKKWGLERGGYVLVVSRLIRHKGIQYLVKAFNNLKEKGLSAGKKLVVVGGGFFTDDFVVELKELAKNNENIIFTGSQTGETLDQLFSNACLFVQPSESEGLSMALLEAMGHGRAVLISDIVENLEAIGDKGFVFKSKDVLDLESKLADLFNRPDLIDEYGEKARQRVKENYSWKKITDQIENLYVELAESKNKVV